MDEEDRIALPWPFVNEGEHLPVAVERLSHCALSRAVGGILQRRTPLPDARSSLKHIEPARQAFVKTESHFGPML